MLRTIMRPKLNGPVIRGSALTQSKAGQGGGELLLPANSRFVAEGDSRTIGSSGPQWSQYFIIRTRGRFYLPLGWNQATGGQTAAQAASQMAATGDLNPRAAFYGMGTNDLGGSADSAAVIFANRRTWLEYMLARGIKTIDFVELPRFAPNALAGDRETVRQELIALQRAQTDVALVDIADAWTIDDTIDGLHENHIGAEKWGNAVGDAANALLRDDEITELYLDSSNLIRAANDNADLTGTTGAKAGTAVPTGDVATNWTVEENGAMTVVCSKTTLGGATAQRIQVSGNSNAAGRIVNFRNDVPLTGLAQIGDTCEAWFQFSLAAGSAGLRSIYVGNDSGMSPNNTATVLMSADAKSGVIRTPITGTIADLTNRVQAVMLFDAGAVAADVTWAKPMLRKVV